MKKLQPGALVCEVISSASPIRLERRIPKRLDDEAQDYGVGVLFTPADQLDDALAF